MNKAAIANEFIEFKESMNGAGEVGDSLAAEGLMTGAQPYWNTSVMRDGSESNP